MSLLRHWSQHDHEGSVAPGVWDDSMRFRDCLIIVTLALDSLTVIAVFVLIAITS